MTIRRKNGFTLIELLVVIAIIAVLASLSAVMGPRMIKKGKQTRSISDMRQMVTTMVGYASDHGNKLPAPAVSAADGEGMPSYWHNHLQMEITGGTLDLYTKDSWWKDNDSIFRNPLWPKKQITYELTGYGMNSKIAQNVAANRGETLGEEEALYTGVNLATINDPVRTPIVMPHWDWQYSGDAAEQDSKQWEMFAVAGRVPVAFLDGHVEVMSPREYVSRELDKMPAP